MTKFETGNLKLGNTRFLVKSHVKSHVRATKTGKHIQVKSYDNSIIKNPKWKSRKWRKQYIEDYRILISRPLLTTGMKKRKKRMEQLFKLRTGLNIKKFVQVKEGIYAQQTQKDLPNYLINRGIENYKSLNVKSPEFKTWFGDWGNEPGKASKVVDKNGKPLTVYHGTHYGGFKAFDPNTLLPGLMGKGFYFTEDKEVAESYMKKGTSVPLLGTYYANIYDLQDIDTRKAVNDIAAQRVKDNEKKLVDVLKMIKESEGLKDYGDFYNIGKKYGYGMITPGWLKSRRAALKKRIASLKSVPNMTDVDLNRYIDESKYRHKIHMPTDRGFYDLVKKRLKPLEPMVYSVYLNIRNPLNMDDPIPKSLKQKVLVVPEIKEGLKKFHDEQSKHAPYGFTFDEPKYKKLYKEKLINAKTYLDFYVALKELTAIKVGMFGDTVDKEHLNDLIIKKIVKENGYDGITHIGGVVTNSNIKHRVWITLKANQIKAVDNRGTFSNKTIDIYKSLSDVRFLIKGRKLHYKTEVQGLPISVENRKGSIRRGKDGKGEWQTKMTAPYGYIRQTLGTDNDPVDCFIGKDKDSQWVYIIHIKDPKTGKYDEDKTFLGFSTFKDAMKVFKQNYDDWGKYYQGFDVMDINEFKRKIKNKGKKLRKSHVKAHLRTTKTGKVVNVRDYSNKKVKSKSVKGHARIVQKNMEHLGTRLSDWKAVPIKNMALTEGDGGKIVMTPEFEMPKGYKSAPSIYKNNSMGSIGNCELCGHEIKNVYWIFNKKKKWVMGVGSECITMFGEGKTGRKLSKEKIWEQNRDLLRETIAVKKTIYNNYAKIVDVYDYSRGFIKKRKWASENAKSDYEFLKEITKYKYPDKESEYTSAESDTSITRWVNKHGDRIRKIIKQHRKDMNKSICYLSKSHVKAHTRAIKTGKIVRVRDYENVKTKKIRKFTYNYEKDLKTVLNLLKIFCRRFDSKEMFQAAISLGEFSSGVIFKKVNDDLQNKSFDEKYRYTNLLTDNRLVKLANSEIKTKNKTNFDFGKFYQKYNKNGLNKSIRYIMKSWSSSIQAKYPGAVWRRVTDTKSPMHGRAILIVPHKSGTATVAWAPHHSGLTHKVLQPKKEGKKEEREKPEKEKPEMSEEERLNAMERKKDIERKQKEVKTEMHEKIRSKLGIETDVTKEEKSKIERDISKIADKQERNIERLKQFNRIKTERDKAIDEVIGEAKEAMLGSDRDIIDMPIEKKQLREVIKENAEEFLKYHYQIKAYKREKSVLSKILKQGGKYRGGTDVVEIKAMNADEIRKVLTDEKAVEMEIEDHYRLIINTRGGIDKNGEEIKGKGTGSETIAQNIRKGGFEAMTGITGEATGSSIIDMDRYKTLGSGNAAVLMNYYFENSMGKERYAKEISDLKNYIEKEGQKIAKQGIGNGDKYLNRAQRVKKFGEGEDALFGDRVQANATALQYIQRAYESYGQAEGSLNQVAELLYQFENKKRNIEYNSNSRQKLNSIRDRLKLNEKDATIEKFGGTYKMTIRPSAFEKLIKEKPVVAKEYGAVSTADIKAGKENTDNYLPEGLKSYSPPDRNGVSQKIVLAPHQQAAARLVVKEKRVYLNHEAGTGKSLSYISSIAAVREKTGKMPKTVISMPQKLMPNFKDEVEKFSDFKVRIITENDNKKARGRIYNGDPNVITLVNKEKFNFDKDMIKNAGYDMVVIDEAHRSTQREGRKASAMSQGIVEVAEKAEYFIAGTGTPTPNDLSELYFYLKVIDPEKYSNQKQFMEKYKNLHRGAGLKDKLAEILHKEINNRVFTVKKDLQHTFNMHSHNVSLTNVQKEAYKKEMVKYRKNRKTVRGAAINRDINLSKILNETKIENNNKFSKMGNIIDNHVKTKGADEKIIIYAKNYNTVNEIERYIKNNYPGKKTVSFTGESTLDEVNENKRLFKTDKSTMFSIHTVAGTEGLNLQYTGKPGEMGATTAIAMASGEDSYSTLDQFYSRSNRMGVPKAMNIDGHLVLTDTPHDIRTEMRLEDKKAVMSLVDNAKRVDDQGLLQGAMQKSITFVLR